MFLVQILLLEMESHGLQLAVDNALNPLAEDVFSEERFCEIKGLEAADQQEACAVWLDQVERQKQRVSHIMEYIITRDPC